jgi:pyrimidine operon attenuation protein / uracil phosphoribosyltransferase
LHNANLSPVKIGDMETVQTKNCILDRQAIGQKMKRMALEVAEQNFNEKELIIAGINGNGEIVAKILTEELNKIYSFKIETIIIHINKKDPQHVSINEEIDFNNKTVIIVDDVANTGRIIMYVLKPFLNFHPKKIQTLVLVERSHKLFPIQNDYTGLSVATTLQEHIAVETEGDEVNGAWLY